MDQSSLPMNLNVHLDKHLGLVQMAEVQSFPPGCMDGRHRAPAAVLFSEQETGQKHCWRMILNSLFKFKLI